MQALLKQKHQHAADPQLLRRLQRLVGKGYVLSRPEELATYEADACLLMRARPDVVVLPATADEVAAIVRLCAELNTPFVARGAGTGLSGGALPVEGGVIIGLNRMNTIVEVDIENRTAIVQPGVVNARLNDTLTPLGLFYAPDPSSMAACTLGGNVAENAGGIHCLKYGVTVDHVLGVEVVLPDGTGPVWLENPARLSHGLNLTGVMVGSEGTLGVVTAIKIRLLPKPACRFVSLLAYGRVSDATRSVSDIIASGLVPAALEFMDAFTVRAVNDAFSVGFPENSEAVLLAEIDGPDAETVAQQHATLLGIVGKHQPIEVRTATTEADCQALWKARKGTVAAYGRTLPAFYLHDCVVPRSRLTEMLRRIDAIAEKYNVIVGNVFHAGDGNLHPNILFDPADDEMIQRVLRAGEEMLEACLAVGGTLTGEHGVGIEKSRYMGRLYTEADLETMAMVKNAFDPQRLANPSKILPVRKGCGEARAGAPAKTAEKLQRLVTEANVWV